MPRGCVASSRWEGDHRGGAIHAHDMRGALAFEGPGVVAIPAGHIQNGQVTQGPEDLKEGEFFAVLLDGQAFGLPVGVRNPLVVGHDLTSQSHAR